MPLAACNTSLEKDIYASLFGRTPCCDPKFRPQVLRSHPYHTTDKPLKSLVMDTLKPENDKGTYIFAVAVMCGLLAVYLPGINYGLLFDDQRLIDGSIFGSYGNLLEIKPRMISYGTFVWIDAVLGEGYWKQRLFNLGLHMGVIAVLYALLKSLLAHTFFPEDIEQQPHFRASQIAALRVGIALFALNPVAVYAVGYLMQRSITMATLFTLLACWAWIKTLETHRLAWFCTAVVSYFLAVLSKEHAVITVGLAVPLYIYIRRPNWKTIALLAVATTILLLGAAALLLRSRESLIGTLVDAQSVAFAQQLEALRPGTTQRIYPLSILNQMGLFWAYGLLWVIPYVGWMSIDLRPSFPLDFFSSWHIVGALAYITLFGTSVWFLVRRTGVLSLVGLLLLLPVLWFLTEFATVWVQDPFVLYRSYLWATVLPGLVAVALTGFKPRTLYIIGTTFALIFGVLALERHLSLRDELTAWTDAAEKINLKDSENAVGRSRPFLNLGAYFLRKGMLDQATHNLAIAQSLGDRGELGGSTLFNLGVVLQQENRNTEALDHFARAESMGFKSFPLYYHRGESLVTTGQLMLAIENFSIALEKAAADPSQKNNLPLMRVRQVEVLMAAQQFDQAIENFKILLKDNPNDPRLQTGLGMAYIGKRETQAAIEIFDALIADHPAGSAYYGRAMAHHLAGRERASVHDLDGLSNSNHATNNIAQCVLW